MVFKRSKWPKLGYSSWSGRTRTRKRLAKARKPFRSVIRFKAAKKQRRRRMRKLRMRRRRAKDGYITHVVKGLSAVKYGNRVTNSLNAPGDDAPRTMDSDFALFNFCPLTYDPYLPWKDYCQIGYFNGDSTANDLNVPNEGINTVLPTLIRASAFWDVDSQTNALADCFEEFRIKTCVFEITVPDVMEVPDTNVPTVNNNLFLMWRFNDDIKPPNVRQFLQRYVSDIERQDRWRVFFPFINAPDFHEIEGSSTEEHRNAAGSNWHRVRLTPGKKIKIKFHPKCWLRSKVGNLQADVFDDVEGTGASITHKRVYFGNPVPNPFSRPARGWVDTDAIEVGTTGAGMSLEDDVFFVGPTFLLLDTSHYNFATYTAPNITIQNSIFQSQFKLQCRYYYKLQFRKVKRYDDNNVKDGGDNGE
uniref:Uncharacterized protein n=1 Tax=Dromedary stool-associated circular ssDNA virus TaxID=1574422 RepID=A0A0A1EIL1_9VIRU|nr:hypothetical protein [Dromedary stool-associated circular ssDNA virus]